MQLIWYYMDVLQYLPVANGPGRFKVFGFSHIQASSLWHGRLFQTFTFFMISAQCSSRMLFGSPFFHFVKLSCSPLLQAHRAYVVLIYLNPIQKSSEKFFVWLYTKLSSSLLAKETKSAPLFLQFLRALYQLDLGAPKFGSVGVTNR